MNEKHIFPIYLVKYYEISYYNALNKLLKHLNDQNHDFFINQKFL